MGKSRGSVTISFTIFVFLLLAFTTGVISFMKHFINSDPQMKSKTYTTTEIAQMIIKKAIHNYAPCVQLHL